MAIVPYEAQTPAFNADWLLDPAEIASRIGGTDFVPRGLRDNPAAITAALLYGAEIGLGVMASLSTISVIDGKPTLAAEAQRALILAAGHELGFEEATASRCIAWGRRKGQREITRVTWTMDDAKRAGLAGKNNWRTYPRAMLVARASAELAREVFPDVLRGLAATEEIEEDGVPGAPDAAPPDDKPKTRRRRRQPKPDPDGNGDGEGGGKAAGATPSGTVEGVRSDPPAPAPATDDPAEAQVEGNGVEEIVAEFGGAAPSVQNPDVVAAPEGPLPWTEEQRRAIFALFGEVGLKGDDQREARLGYTARVINRPLETSADLTQAEASSLIEDLHRIEGLPPDDRWRELLPERELRLVEEGDEIGTWSEP